MFIALEIKKSTHDISSNTAGQLGGATNVRFCRKTISTL